MHKLLVAVAIFAALLPSYADADQPTYDFDFGSLLYGPPGGSDQQTTLAVDSVGGNDANAGTLQSPKLTLPTSLASNEELGLYRGSRFLASLPLHSDTSLSGISVRGLSLARGLLPVVSALDPVTTGSVTSYGDGTYTYLWTPGDRTIANDGYQNVYMVEINTATENAMPIASRRRMADVTATGGAAGTVWVQAPGTGTGQSGSSTQWRAIFHPSDSLAPGSGSYRYEVVSRFAPANWGGSNNTGDGAMSGVELMGSSWGYGSLGAPTGFAGDRLAVLHCSTHNAVIGGGSLQRSVFYEMGALSGSSGPSIQLAWYASVATGLSWTLDRCLFYANVGDRLPNAVISHSGGGHAYDRGDISDCAFIGARRANGALQGTAIDYNDCLAGTVSRVYVQSFNGAFGFNMPLAAEVKNSVFRDVQFARVGCNFHDNIVLAQSATDPASNGNYPTALVLQQNGASATNNLLWTHGLAGYTVGASDQAFGVNFYPGVNAAAIQRNIIVLDPANTSIAAIYAALPSTVSGLTMDYNLVINVAKAGFATLGGGSGNTSSWAQYQSIYTSLDQHSMYVDLSADPRGLKAVFVDPINGDFRWAQTEVASQCAAYCAANHVGPATVTSRWPVVPSVDEAVAAISLLPPKITGPGAVTFTRGASGRYQITTDLDGTPDAPTNYSVSGQPDWLNVVASSGVISGTPPQAGDISLSVSAANRAGAGSAALSITVQTAFMAWQNTYFTTAEINDPAISGPNATPAGDGIPNLMKYALGLNPKLDGTGALPTISFTAAGGSQFLTLTYNQSLAANDVSYRVEVSGDLQAWSSGSNDTVTVSTITNAADTMQTVVQRDLTPISSVGRRFIRLKIIQL